MGPFILAWLVGEGIIVYRSVKVQKVPPGPGQLMFSSAVFVMLALLAESEQARPLATTLAWGFDIAAFMKVFDKISGTPSGAWPPAKAPDTEVFPGITS
jgi:hypothetical protein